MASVRKRAAEANLSDRHLEHTCGRFAVRLWKRDNQSCVCIRGSVWIGAFAADVHQRDALVWGSWRAGACLRGKMLVSSRARLDTPFPGRQHPLDQPPASGGAEKRDKS